MAEKETFRGEIRTSILDSTPWWPEKKHAPEGAPNVLYIVLDDTGYSQLGCYGSLIPTPSMDALALDGVRYTDFNVCALCSPTRSCLMTGYNNQTVGMSFLSANDMGYPNLVGRIDKRFGFLPEVLRENGYATFAVGKWHVTNESEVSGAGPFDNWPLGRGFDRYYGFLNGATNQFYPELVRDNTMIDPPAAPEEGYHLSADLIDNAIKYIGTEKSVYPDKPFFCYLALGAMHSPHQAPREYIDKFSGAFDMGYEEYRKLVFEKQKEIGLLPDSAELTGINSWARPWGELNAWERRVFARYMEAFAGFLNYTDEQIGRLIAFLKQIGQYDNTMIVLMSDNGAAAGGGKNGCLSEHYHIHTGKEPPLVSEEEYARIGTPEACNLYPTGWAWAGNTPMKLYKHWVHNGGVKVPFSITWPERIRDRGGYRRQFHYVTDLFPTVLEACGIPMPEYINGFKQLPRPGVSMVYSFDEPDAPSHRKMQYFEMAGNRGIYCDGWKAVADHVNSPSFDADKWELYHVEEDFCENHDLAEKYPEKLAELKALWWQEAEKNGVFPMLESHLSTRNGIQWGSQVRLRPVPPRQHFAYYAGMEINAPVPRLKNKPFSLDAQVDYRAGDEGILFACGFNIGGYVLYVESGRLCFHYNFVDSEYMDAVSSAPLPEGEHTFGFRFETEKPGEGWGTVTVDGAPAGECVRFTDSGFMVKSCIGVGRYSASAVKRSHKSRPNHFAYTGKYSRVDLFIGAPETHEDRLDAIALHHENE
jgi:arylsulfatase A-like enzyme